ncbi:hypothetical protein QFC20_006704 [Naganishia adeliensis]|uniref:Uncharacterized protein n=1 Tax=Naganishia adeliensis TaxID=92952 RepID=A0ACC2V7F9_9TREE|nr:hypothetical protein QFC20_006704 [Naganishia adeliensis]
MSQSTDTMVSRKAENDSKQTINFQPNADRKDASSLDAQRNDWPLYDEVIEMKKQSDQVLPEKKLGVTWSNLTVKGKASSTVLHDTLFSLFNIPDKIKRGRNKVADKVILDDSFGCVEPGKMLLVLARPDGGATTLLTLLSNKRAGYTAIEGDVKFGTMDHAQAEQYRGEIVMNEEDEVFYPHMTVGQTVEFATSLKTPAYAVSDAEKRKQHREQMISFLLRSMSIEHTKSTPVGNEYVRGVSGGERKRLSIIETLATRATVICWDNSTRGLDASTALAWTQAVRTITDILGLSSIITLYQAGNGIYDLMDDVLVLDHGSTIYYGPRESAKPFFESLGFEYTTGANVADMLTGVTVPTERKIAKGWENRFPRTAKAIREAYQDSNIYREMRGRLEYPATEEARINTENFKQAVKISRHKSLSEKSPLMVPYWEQILVLAKRQFWQIWGDKLLLYIRYGNTIVQALIMGSLFYDMPENSTGLFLRGGTIFFSTVYHTLVAMNEVEATFKGRPVLAKHKGFAFFNPFTYVIAQIFSDIPVIFVQVTLFALILYFMTGLLMTAGAFFTYFALVYANTMAVTAFFRMIGTAFSTFNNASKVSGLAVVVLFTYSGYIVQKPVMKPWFSWIMWIDPLYYAVEGMLATELRGREFSCEGPNLIPTGPGYAGGPASCAGVGGSIGTSVNGSDYLKFLRFSATTAWRNFGVIWAFWFLFVGATVLLMTYGVNSTAGGSQMEFARNAATLGDTSTYVLGSEDEEKQGSADSPALPAIKAEETRTQASAEKALIENKSVFTWKDLTYTVKTAEGDRVLLDQVHGFIKPGTLSALMGSSDNFARCSAQRKTEGELSGKIHVDGRVLPLAFQRSAGYCEQQDVHEPLATVREALEFSAILRQPKETSREEKIAYVDTIVELLGMKDIEHALVGQPGNGLNVEQRKRLTIGVELVAKPSILLFLDEPTSGLDSQSAFSIVKFLRKLADAGQAVLVTIHQPSASLFYEFDNLLLLARCGKTVYNGPIGHQAESVKSYFAEKGAPCPDSANPAEHMIDVVSGHLAKQQDWNQTWLDSDANKGMMKELHDIEEGALSRPVAYDEQGEEFAASLWEQCKVVCHRNSVSLFRDTEYVTNKFALHIFSALFNGFTFWMIGDSASDLQMQVFTIFSFIFVAPGVQPLFIARRDIFEAREKKAKIYNWKSFTFGLIVSEFPYLLICALLYYGCWYFTVGFPGKASRAGPVFLEILLYEFIYTGIGQFVASYAKDASMAALVNPLLLGTLLSFAGVFVPYSAIPAFWRYWLYYLDVFTYVMGSILWFVMWDQPVNCRPNELATFNPPDGQTCGAYLNSYVTTVNPGANLLNPSASANCQVCTYTTGTDYLRTLNITDKTDGWIMIGITGIFVVSSYALVFVMMKLRTKATKKAD